MKDELPEVLTIFENKILNEAGRVVATVEDRSIARLFALSPEFLRVAKDIVEFYELQEEQLDRLAPRVHVRVLELGRLIKRV